MPLQDSVATRESRPPPVRTPAARRTPGPARRACRYDATTPSSPWLQPITGIDGARRFAPNSSFRSLLGDTAAPQPLGHNGPRASVAQLDRAAAF